MDTQVEQVCSEPTDFTEYLKRKDQQETCTSGNKKRAVRQTTAIAEDKRMTSHPERRASYFVPQNQKEG